MKYPRAVFITACCILVPAWCALWVKGFPVIVAWVVGE